MTEVKLLQLLKKETEDKIQKALDDFIETTGLELINVNIKCENLCGATDEVLNQLITVNVDVKL